MDLSVSHERRNLVSARVPSHFNWPVLIFYSYRETSTKGMLTHLSTLILFFFWRESPLWAMASSFTRFQDRTQRRTAVGRISVDEWLARLRDLYLTTLTRDKTSMPSVGFEPTISASERPQTYAIDRAATGTGLTQCTLD